LYTQSDSEIGAGSSCMAEVCWGRSHRQCRLYLAFHLYSLVVVFFKHVMKLLINFA